MGLKRLFPQIDVSVFTLQRKINAADALKRR